MLTGQCPVKLPPLTELHELLQIQRKQTGALPMKLENPRVKVPLFQFEESTVYFLEYVTQCIFLCHCFEVHLTIKRKHDNKSGRELSEAWLVDNRLSAG